MAIKSFYELVPGDWFTTNGNVQHQLAEEGGEFLRSECGKVFPGRDATHCVDSEKPRRCGRCSTAIAKRTARA